MAGTLWLLPVGLGDAAWTTWLPGSVQARACTLTRFIAENARSARAALKAIGHPGPLQTLVIEEIPRVPAAADIDRLLEPLAAGADIGLLSEAGCPAVADPGAAYVRRAHERGFTVRPLVGPSALLLTLMASGLDGQRFAFRLVQPIDPAGALPGGRSFRDIRELKRLLAQDERQIARNLVERLIVFATGAPVRFSDRPVVEAILDRSAPENYGIRSLIRNIITSEIFRKK